MYNDKEQKMEEWRNIEYNGFRFIVSNLGQVKRPERTIQKTRSRFGKTQTFDSVEPEKILSAPFADKRGYREVSIRVNGVRKRFSVHRLVAFAFCDGYAPGLHVDHLNGDKSDNRACNLEWVTCEENVSRAWKNGLNENLKGENNPSSVLTYTKVRILRKLFREGVSPSALAKLLDVDPHTLYRIKNGEAWKHID